MQLRFKRRGTAEEIGVIEAVLEFQDGDEDLAAVIATIEPYYGKGARGGRRVIGWRVRAGEEIPDLEPPFLKRTLAEARREIAARCYVAIVGVRESRPRS